jgi:hypothetical protein
MGQYCIYARLGGTLVRWQMWSISTTGVHACNDTSMKYDTLVNFILAVLGSSDGCHLLQSLLATNDTSHSSQPSHLSNISPTQYVRQESGVPACLPSPVLPSPCCGIASSLLSLSLSHCLFLYLTSHLSLPLPMP